MEDIELEYHKHSDFLEEAHFAIDYTPVPDRTVARGIDGVLATVHDIKEKVIANRRVSVLRDLGALSAEAKTTEETCSITAETLARPPKDFILIDDDRSEPRSAEWPATPETSKDSLVVEIPRPHGLVGAAQHG